jgi:uncharacterized protein DUF4394
MTGKRWVAAAALALTGWAAPAASAETVFGVTDSNHLVTFDSQPTTLLSDRAITGLPGTDRILAIDVRPATLQIYGISDADRLYRIDASTGAATAIGDPLTLGGNQVGIDFNPIVDRIRVVTDSGQNLRVNPTDGSVITDSGLNGNPTIANVAYTNNGPASSTFPNAPTTQLFDIDTADDALKEQDPPNNGTLMPKGPLGVDVGGPVGFDVSTTSEAGTGLPQTNTAYAVMRPVSDQLPRLYTINLATGAATEIGQLPAPGVRDIAVAPPVPTFAVLVNNLLGQSLATVRADRPGTVTVVGSISGLSLGERLVGIDRRPNGNGLYGVSDAERLYTIDPASGAATPVGNAAFTPALDGSSFGVDFDPAADTLRVVSDADQNLAIAPADGTATAGKPLSYVNQPSPPDPEITGFAYANSTALGIDSGIDSLAKEESAGTMSVVGALGVDPAGANGYEVVQRFNHGFAVLDVGGTRSLYAINAVAPAGGAANGSATRIGTFNTPLGGAPLGLAVLNEASPIPPPEATPTPTPTPTATPGQRVKPGLTVTIKPKRDRAKPFKFKVKGRLALPDGVAKADGCKGRVRITAKRKTKRFARTFTPVGKACGFAKKVKLRKAGKRGKARFAVRFGGNRALTPRTVAKTVKYGK